MVVGARGRQKKAGTLGAGQIGGDGEGEGGGVGQQRLKTLARADWGQWAVGSGASVTVERGWVIRGLSAAATRAGFGCSSAAVLGCWGTANSGRQPLQAG